MAEIKTTNEGRPINTVKCWNFDRCGNTFIKTRKNRLSCSNRCAQLRSPKWQNRNKKTPK